MSSLAETKRKLIAANHILHYHDIVDAYGHISVRHPDKPDVYLMSGYMAPAVVASPDDLVEYYVKDSSTVDPNAKKGYSERFIHGELFGRFPEVNCVIHSHSESVLPYVTSGVPMMAIYHMSGFLGKSVPVFDIVDHYPPDAKQDMLVNTNELGAALASKFANAKSGNSTKPDHTVVLMRRHGFTAQGPDIETTVYRAIYTKINAATQTQSILLRQSYVQIHGGGNQEMFNFDLEGLNDRQCDDCKEMNERFQSKPWQLWVQEVENSKLYTNNG